MLYKETIKSVDGKIVKLKEPKVMMIDIDEMVSPTIGQKNLVIGTASYLTVELLHNNSSDTFYNSLNFNILLKVFLKMQFYKIQ